MSSRSPTAIICPCALCADKDKWFEPRTVTKHLRKNPPVAAPAQSFAQWEASQAGGPSTQVPERLATEMDVDRSGGALAPRPASSMSIDDPLGVGSRHDEDTQLEVEPNEPNVGTSSTPLHVLPERHYSIPIPRDPSPIPCPVTPEEPDEDPEPTSLDDAIQQELDIAAAVQNIVINATADLAAPFETLDDEEDTISSTIEDVAIAQEFIKDIRGATLDNDKLPEEVIERLQNPPQSIRDNDNPTSEGSESMSDSDSELDDLFHIELYLATQNAPQSVYNRARDALHRRFGDSMTIPSLYQIRKRIADITGVVEVQDDMCFNSCIAFTSPFASRTHCPTCGESRYDEKALAESGEKIPRKQMTTIPLGPQIQALRRSPEGAKAMRYRHSKMEAVSEHFAKMKADRTMEDAVYDDVFCGQDYRKLHKKLNITEDDVVVSFSLDGAQLYQNVESDTWIGIWVVQDYDPSTHFKRKHVLPAFIVPGPNKPKNLDSLIYRSFHHLSAIQRLNDGKGLACWDCLKKAIIYSRIILFLNTADAPALAEVDGRVGHHGARGCRLGCPMKGRHKPSSGHYYAVHLRPHHYTVLDCDHDDVDLRRVAQSVNTVNYAEELDMVLSARTDGDYARSRKETGISKPSILSGLVPQYMLSVPHCFTVDLMHLFFLNFGELLIPLWRGTLKCESSDSVTSWDWATLTGDVWTAHGQLVGNATQYFPSSFHRPPRNPAEKINSGFKATEYYLYLFGLGPGYFRAVLPKKYWRNFCRLVLSVRTLIQRRVTGGQLAEAHSQAIQFIEEYEALYYQRRVDRLHFCCPCLHTLLHVAPEAMRVGPGAYSTQFTMERAIGDLGREIRQPSNPFGNLARIARRVSQVNALKVIYPQLDSLPPQPRASHDAGNGYIYLTPRIQMARAISGPHGDVIEASIGTRTVQKWGRIRLPNHQVARSVYSEALLARRNTRVARNVKMHINQDTEYGEVLFYFLQAVPIGGTNKFQFRPKALVSFYSPPDPDLLEDSYRTLWACSISGADVRVVDIGAILSVVSMQPLPLVEGDRDGLWFVVQKSGLDDLEFSGHYDSLADD